MHYDMFTSSAKAELHAYLANRCMVVGVWMWHVDGLVEKKRLQKLPRIKTERLQVGAVPPSLSRCKNVEVEMQELMNR
jgi:hypothetical protein